MVVTHHAPDFLIAYMPFWLVLEEFADDILDAIHSNNLFLVWSFKIFKSNDIIPHFFLSICHFLDLYQVQNEN